MTEEKKKTPSETLKESPMLYLSSGSKELFHSNFLYWLGIRYRDTFQKMMSKFCDINREWPDGWRVRREHNHLDLCITYDRPKTSRKKNSGTDEHVFVIVENKVKSVPDITQLKRYEDLYDENRKKGCTYVLLSLMKDFHGKDILKDEKKWQIRNYEDLAEEIRNMFVKEFPVSNEHIQYVKDYCVYIENLSKLAEEWIIDDSKSFLTPVDEFGELRLNDIYQKIRYAQIAAKLARRLADENISEKIVLGMSNFDVIVKKRKDSEKILGLYGCHNADPFNIIFLSSGMAHSIGFVEAKVKVADDCCAVIQVQGDRYCRGIEKNGIVNNSNQLASYMQYYIEFNDSNHDKVYSKECHYSDGFLYKAQKVSDGDTINVVLSRMINDINSILKWQFF